MCKERSISKLAFIIFIILQNYIMFNYYFLSESVKTNKQVGYFIFIIVYIISLFMIWLLPKKISKIKYFDLIKKSFLLKYFLLIAKSTILFITLLIGVKTLSFALFPDTNPFIFIVSLLAVSLFIARFNPENIINTSCILFICGMVLMVIPLFFNFNIKDYTYLLPITTIKNFSTLSCIYLFLDSITLLFLNDGLTINKKDITIGVSVLFLICIIETINVIMLTGSDYLYKNEFLGFFSLYIQDTLTYIGNLSFIYIFLIPCVCVFKSSLSIVFIKKITNIKNNILFDLILFSLLMVLLYLCVGLSKDIITILIYIVIISLIPIYLFFVFNRSENIEVTM